MLENKIQINDIHDRKDYANLRGQLRKEIVSRKKRRRIDVGPYVTLYFENKDTIIHQINEMVFIENGGSIYGFEHHFNIDPSVITIESVTQGDNIQDFVVQTNMNNNKFIVAGASSNEDGISGTFFTLTGLINEGNINSVATPIYLEKIRLNEDGVQLDSSNYTTLIINGTVGDIYIDEIINVVDIVAVINYIFETLIPTPYQAWASDINNDLEINVVDIVALVNIIFEQEYNE